MVPPSSEAWVRIGHDTFGRRCFGCRRVVLEKMAVLSGEVGPTRNELTLRRGRLSGYVGKAEAAHEMGLTRGERHAVDKPHRHWVINGDFLGIKPTGVARYATETTLALDALVAAGHPLTQGLSLTIVSPRAVALKLRAIAMRVVPEFNRPRLPQFWVQAQLPRHVDGGLLSFCNLAPVRVRRQIVCMHDAHTWLAPESYGRMFRWLHRAMLPVLGRRVAHVTTVSEFSRSQLVSLGVVPADRVTVTFNGSDHADRWNAERLLLASGQRPYVIAIGRDQPYKNLDLLLSMAPMLDMIGVDLWIAGDLGGRADELQARAANGCIRLLGRVGDDALKGALAGALGFLFPSRIEGFGLPAVEAMASGCPVIASTSPCLPEICGEAALYAGPDDPEAWVLHVARLKCEPQFRARLVNAGRLRAAQYTWRRVAETYLELMRQIDRVGQTVA
jgi:glycosyltransferase involved in cell wall biosynthesis